MILHSNALGVENSLFWQYQPWKSQKQKLGSKNVRSMTPQEVRFLMPNKILHFGFQKEYKGPKKTEKTVFLINGPSHNLPEIKYVISEPHEVIPQWNLSCSLTFDFFGSPEGQ